MNQPYACWVGVREDLDNNAVVYRIDEASTELVVPEFERPMVAKDLVHGTDHVVVGGDQLNWWLDMLGNGELTELRGIFEEMIRDLDVAWKRRHHIEQA